jgi:hypothetical protein
VGQVRIGNDEVGREHRCSDFSAVATVADERSQETRALGWLKIGKRGSATRK